MEEKERYYYDDLGEDIYDRKTDRYPSNEAICDILNAQIERIKNLEQENKQLKQSQKQLAIEELRCIKEYILTNDEYDEEGGCNIIETFDLLEDIRDRIEKLGGGR